jgi:hypothetical protein
MKDVVLKALSCGVRRVKFSQSIVLIKTRNADGVPKADITIAEPTEVQILRASIQWNAERQ